MAAVTDRLGPELLDRLAAAPSAALVLGSLGEADGVHLVGGAVRDLLRGVAPLDLDVVVDGEVEGVLARLGVPARTHDRFGTATVALDGVRLDVARARRERYPRPGALPEVEPAPLAEDLRRRDFTVNALALALGGPRRGELTAVAHALDDLDAGTLRVLHDASFLDDPTRLLRLGRYAARLGFTPAPETAALARRAIADGAPATVSAPRLGAELRLAADEPDPVAALAALGDLGLGEALISGLRLRDDGPATRALAILPDDGDPGTLALAAAALDIDPDPLGRRLDELGFTAGRRDAITAAAGGARALALALAATDRPSEAARAIAGMPVEGIALAGALGDPAVLRAASRWLDELRHVALAIDGRDLLAAGIAPGPAVGVGLRAALAARVDGEAAGREAELAVALGAARAHGG